jgi:alpha-methylacyl-CoA racemase
MTSIRPLEDLTVIDLTVLPPGGFCTVQLADLGADVIRVEPLALAGQRSLVIGQVGLSRGKRSMTLDQRHPRANEVLSRIARSADILVENAQPGAMAARGYGYPQAATDAPRLIWCSITGFGQDGPYAGRSGHDLSYLGHSGLLAALAPDLPWHPAAMVSVPLGAMMATTGILAAVIERNRSGKGCQIDISLAESSTWLLGGMPGALKDGFRGIQASPDRRLYVCSDGKFLSVAASEPRTWAALCDGLDAPDLSDKLGVQGDAAALAVARLNEIFAARPAAEWVAKLGPLGAAVNAVNQGRDVVDDPQYAARRAFLNVAGEDVPANPVRLQDALGRRSEEAVGEPPLVGEHTVEVLAAAGFTAREIDDLKSNGVV